MGIPEIITRQYKGNFKERLSAEDLAAFVQEYFLIVGLKAEYEKGETNRKLLAKEIVDRINNMSTMLEVLRVELSIGSKYDYSTPEYISDYSKMLSLILQIANVEGEKYILKSFHAEQWGSLETSHGDRETGMYRGEILVIGEKNVLDNIDNSKAYYGEKFRILATELVKAGHSLVMITNYYYESNILIYSWQVQAKNHSFKVSGNFSNLCCYTYDDELGSAVDKVAGYIEEYSGNVDNIPIATLITRINDLTKKKSAQKALENPQAS